MGARIAVVDYHKGNLASVQRGLSDAGFNAVITDDAAAIRSADGIVLPGVGAFADAMATMNETGQADAIRAAVAAGAPFLGICLGLHLLFEWGDEGCPAGARMEGLGILPGHVMRVESFDPAGNKLKVPHVGWNTVDFTQTVQIDGQAASPVPLFAGVPDHSHFYFTHSYNIVADSADDVIATTTHARPFDSAVAHGLVFGVQFHPEKSSALGLRVLSNFGTIVESFG